MKYTPDINCVKLNFIELYDVNIWGIFHTPDINFVKLNFIELEFLLQLTY